MLIILLYLIQFISDVETRTNMKKYVFHSNGYAIRLLVNSIKRYTCAHNLILK